LAGASLRGAQLKGAQLTRADLARAQLDGADLEAADLSGASLVEARLDGADLSGAHLTEAALQGASLVRAHLAHASLDGARLRGAHLDEATLWGATLRGAELDGAHFTGADMHDTELDGAFFAGAALGDADLALLRWEPLHAGEELAAARGPLQERPEAYRAAADAYRRLRQACAAQGLYDRAGELYRREMRMRQRADGYEAWLALWQVPLLGWLIRGTAIVCLTLALLALRWLRQLLAPTHTLADPVGRGWRTLRLTGAALARPWRPVARWAWHAALEVLCGHGERVGRVLVAAAVIIMGMALVYVRLGQLTEADGHSVTSFWHALYFSAASFSSIGYATFAPSAHGLAKWLGVAESFTGNFLLALFLVTFTRKLTR
jgi:tetratricopeptide (TPR) repeat protein